MDDAPSPLQCHPGPCHCTFVRRVLPLHLLVLPCCVGRLLRLLSMWNCSRLLLLLLLLLNSSWGELLCLLLLLLLLPIMLAIWNYCRSRLLLLLLLLLPIMLPIWNSDCRSRLLLLRSWSGLGLLLLLLLLAIWNCRSRLLLLLQLLLPIMLLPMLPICGCSSRLLLLSSGSNNMLLSRLVPWGTWIPLHSASTWFHGAPGYWSTARSWSQALP